MAIGRRTEFTPRWSSCSAPMWRMHPHRPPLPQPRGPRWRTNTQAPSARPAAQDDSVKRAVEDDVAQTRDKQCADAQARYKQLIEGRRLYKAGADGERQYLTSEEIDSERINAKRDVDTICNSAT